MSDLWKSLPLSSREPVDESGVVAGWDAEIAAVRTAAARLLTAHPDAEAAAVFEADAAPRRGVLPRRAGRAPLRDLDRAVYAYLDLCARLAAEPDLPPRASGAVALGRAAAAPTPIRAVIAGHALRATDAGWSFGTGPVLEDTAAGLLRFLGRRTAAAPRPAAGA